MTKLRLTFGKSEPWNSGWKGWSDIVNIFLDGEKIGTLEADSCERKRYLEYFIRSEHPKLNSSSALIGAFGLKAAKQRARDLFERAEGSEKSAARGELCR